MHTIPQWDCAKAGGQCCSLPGWDPWCWARRWRGRRRIHTELDQDRYKDLWSLLSSPGPHLPGEETGNVIGHVIGDMLLLTQWLMYLMVYLAGSGFISLSALVIQTSIWKIHNNTLTYWCEERRGGDERREKERRGEENREEETRIGGDFLCHLVYQDQQPVTPEQRQLGRWWRTSLLQHQLPTSSC